MPTLTTETLAVTIEAPFADVLADLAEVRNHPEWATEFFAGPARAADAEGEAIVVVPMMGGEVRMRAQVTPEVGVIDLYLAPVGAPYGPPVPIRVLPNGDGADVLFTLARMPGMPDGAWQGGVASMRAELANLKARLEGQKTA